MFTWRNLFDFASHMEAVGLSLQWEGHDAMRFENGGKLIRYGTIDREPDGIDDNVNFRAKCVIQMVERNDLAALTPVGQGVGEKTIRGLGKVCCFPLNPKDRPNWYREVGLSDDDYQTICRFVQPMRNKMLQEMQGDTQEPRPDYLTFGDFFNFIRMVPRDWYGIYRPWTTNRLCLHIYDRYTQCNFAEIDDKDFPLAKVVFRPKDDEAKCYLCKDGSMVHDSLRIFKMSDPFCFGTDEHPVTWWSGWITRAEYEFFRDLMGPYRRGEKAF